MQYTSHEIRTKFIEFFQEKEHSIIGSASLIPEHDPTVLFTTAGMHPLMPYLLGEPHPAGVRLANYQKCIRTGDIEEVGDRWHLTFFEMLGSWSLGDYFKKEAIEMSFEFLTSEKWLNIPIDRLSVTVFEGDDDAPRDDEAATIWRNVGMPAEQIYYYDKKENWWGPPGSTGPCGPDTEMFYDTGIAACGPECEPKCSCGKYVEIWNDVFMQYSKNDDGSFQPLSQQNIDTGMGLERIVAVLNGYTEVYQTDLFQPLMQAITALVKDDQDTSKEIIADHIRSATFIIADGVSPSNMDQGYVLRRLIRRAVRHGRKLGIEDFFLGDLAKIVIDQYGQYYSNLEDNRSEIVLEIVAEEEKFAKTLRQGEKLFKKMAKKVQPNETMAAEEVFKLYDTFGFPLEITKELAHERGILVDEVGFNKLFEEHQAKSRAGAKQKFKGGLADASWETVRGHTATHLLHEACMRLLGEHATQKGSNITPERLRFDFAHPEKLTDEQIQALEDMVNEQIEAGLDVFYKIMPVDEALEAKAIGLFDDKYAEKVKVYFMGSEDIDLKDNFSREFCGGPHVNNTKEVGKFKILKEEAVSSGVRRIKAVVQDA